MKMASLFGLVGILVACGSNGSGGDVCRDGCSKAAKACGSTFDLQSCNASCGALDGGTQPMFPEACKSKADAYYNCAKSAQFTCPDGMHPQLSGCQMELSDFAACLQSAKGDGGTTM